MLTAITSALAGIILLAVVKYPDALPTWIRCRIHATDLRDEPSEQNQSTAMSASKRTEIIKELDGEFISRNSSTLVIRNKRLRIVFSAHSSGNKVPLMVFIHGFGGQVSQWREQLEHFSQSCNVLAVDLVGHGISEVSERQEDYLLSSIVHDIYEVLKSYEDAHINNVVLVAHSFGTMVSVKLVERAPHLFSRLALLAPVMSLATHKTWITQIPTWGLDILRWFDRLGGIHSVSVRRVVHALAPDNIRERQLKWNSTSRSLVVQLMLSSKSNIDATSYQRLSDVPLILIGGESDTLSPPQLLTDIMRWVRPNCNQDKNEPFFICVEGCGHNPMSEKPSSVNSILEAFVLKAEVS